MKSVTSAILGAAVLGQVSSAFTVGSHAHRHTHVHTRRTPDADATAVKFMEPSDVTLLGKLGIKVGVNAAYSSSEAVAVGQGGDYLVQLNNKGADDIVVVAWSGEGQWGAVAAGFVGAVQPDVTHTLKANTTTYISYTPSKYKGTGCDISGALAPIYPGGGLTPFSGQVDDTWVEFTFTNDDSFSATDVSRLINMKGHKVEVHNYADKAAQTAKKPACSSTMDACSFVCPEGATNCMVGTLQNCPVGQAGTLGNAAGTDGGCGGLGTKEGVVEVNFY